MKTLSETIRRNRAGEPVALTSICSAHPDVLTAAILAARSRNRPILIEATSNQVNQFGGYTGMRPADFIAAVNTIADRHGLDRALLLFGGDHLGPQAWRHLPADAAMAHAHAMLREYVASGFTKIHLDCSEGCAGEPAQLEDALTADRAASLAATCEVEAASPLAYVIGTEVPLPGGARAGLPAGIAITTPERASATIAAHQNAFPPETFAKVVGLVVQPGLEFAPGHIDRFDITAPNHLSAALAGSPGIAFEAHSTDYQHPDVFRSLASRNFAILKVGPALTFAYRRAIYALDAIAAWTAPGHAPLPALMETLMLREQKYWRAHIDANDSTLRHFGYADRIRYYWAFPEAQAAVTALHALPRPPDPLLSQHFSPEVVDAAASLKLPWSRALVVAEIQAALAPYLAVAP